MDELPSILPDRLKLSSYIWCPVPPYETIKARKKLELTSEPAGSMPGFHLSFFSELFRDNSKGIELMNQSLLSENSPMAAFFYCRYYLIHNSLTFLFLAVVFSSFSLPY